MSGETVMINKELLDKVKYYLVIDKFINKFLSYNLLSFEEINQKRLLMNDFVMIFNHDKLNLNIWKLGSYKTIERLDIPDLYINKNKLANYIEFISSISLDIKQYYDQSDLTHKKLNDLYSSIPATLHYKNMELQKMIGANNQHIGIIKKLKYFLLQKKQIKQRNLSKNQKKNNKNKGDLIAREWTEQYHNYHDLFPVARKIQRKITLFIGPTNSGKTFNALNKLTSYGRGVYLAPLRLLALEGQEEIESRGFPCSFVTGEEKDIKENATYIAQTIETFNYNIEVDAVLIDEIQMLSDESRGWAWTQAIIGAPSKNIILTGSLDSRDLVTKICDLLGDDLEIVELDRFTKLEVLNQPEDLSINNIANLEESTAIIVFSRKSVLKYKYLFEQNNIPVSIIYGNLSPEVRREEAKKFRTGVTKYLISTDAIAMGLNLPIQKVVFGEIQKFNGKEIDFIKSNEVRQIAGRAGRYGKFDKGLVSSIDESSLSFIKKQINIPNIIKEQLYVRPTLFQVLFLSEQMNSTSLVKIYDMFFKMVMGQKNIYKCADLSPILELAKILDDSQLTLEEKYDFSNIPVDNNNLKCLDVFKNWVISFANKETIMAEEYLKVPSKETKTFSQEGLLNAELNVKILTAYSWLALKKNKFAIDEIGCKKLKNKFNDYIVECLKSKIAGKKCIDCNTPLSYDVPHVKCDKCFHQKRKNSYVDDIYVTENKKR